MYNFPFGATERANACDTAPLPVPDSMTFDPGLRPNASVITAASVE